MVRMMRGAGVSTLSNPKPESQRRELAIISILISHLSEGYPTVWGASLNDIFPRVDSSEVHELPAAIAATGNDIKDITVFVMGHLHLGHAGGLEHFRNTDVPVYVHEIEIKHAFYAVVTKADLGVYLPTYLQFNINCQAWTSDSLEPTQGITPKHATGHTPGLSIMVVSLQESGAWIFTTDQYHVRENYEDPHSHQIIKMLAKRTNAKVVLGHDKERLLQYKKPGKEFYL
ncbi:hypothetical protein DL95DRAFT_434081 [Leptodontidium sp. 2 PMI_412]|nr:hypothetical protein DL95DRAFT_434081 [Leptodontidium sp. 2 PMI_412]